MADHMDFAAIEERAALARTWKLSYKARPDTRTGILEVWDVFLAMGPFDADIDQDNRHGYDALIAGETIAHLGQDVETLIAQIRQLEANAAAIRVRTR